MSNPWNASLLIDNLADRATLSASSSAPLTPPSILQNPHIARKTRFGAVTGQHVVADFGSPVALDTAAMFGLNLSATGTARVRASLADSSGISGDAYDSGDLTGEVDPAYGALINLAAAPYTARYLRIDLSDASLDVLEAGRLVAGARTMTSINYAFGWTRRWIDRSRRTESRGGQTYVDADNGYRTASVVFEALNEDERNGIIEQMDRVNGARLDILLILKSDSDNLGRDSIWGLVDEVSEVTQPQGWIGGSPIFQKPIRIRERL